jgi:hypothetical protein
VSNPSSACFNKLVFKEVPESTGEMIAHNVAAIAELTERIKALDTSISRLAAERYPETIYLQTVDIARLSMNDSRFAKASRVCDYGCE